MLPYSSAEAATKALGRNLTTSEALWVRHTATVPDAWLYLCSVAVAVLTYNAVAVPALLLQHLHALRFRAVEKHRIQQGSRTSTAEVIGCWKSVSTMFLAVAAPLAVASAPAFKLAGVRTGLPLPGAWEMALQLVVYFLVEDFGHYWIHRWLHSPWGFSNIHHVHHQFSTPMTLAAPYAHWAEVVLLGAPTFLGPGLVPGHALTLWVWVCLRQLEAHHIHCGYEFPSCGPAWAAVPFYAGVEYHDYHHRVGGKSHSNFASVFTYCDEIYGTNRGYKFVKRRGRIHREGRQQQQLHRASSLWKIA